MPRPAKGQVVERQGRRGTSFSLRFSAYGQRHRMPLGFSSEGWDHPRAQRELENTLADVRRGVWRPGVKPNAPPPPPAEPTFHEFASAWFDARKDELRETTQADYMWRLSSHLLPQLADYRLSEITVERVDAYKAFKVREREEHKAARARGEDLGCPLSNRSINMTLSLLASILETAVEYGHLSANPARGRRRRLKELTPARTCLQTHQVAALLDAAAQMDARRAAIDRGETGWRRPLVAVLALSGLRIGEALGLRWRHVDLMAAQLEVVASKTDAGRRTVELLPALRELLAEYRARARHVGPDDFVFATRTGKRQNPNNVRNRLLAAEAPEGYGETAVSRADAALQADGWTPLPKITPHTFRRTYVALLLAVDTPLRKVMRQLGHTKSAMTLDIYNQMEVDREEAATLLGCEKANSGQNPQSAPVLG